MNASFENLVTSINGQDYYAQSVDLSESIGIEYFAAMGTRSYSAFPTSKPEGSINTDASRSLDVSNLISDVDYEKTNLTGTSGMCNNQSGEGFYKRSGFIDLKNLCGNEIGRLDITGYLSSRSFSAEPGGEVVQSLSIEEKYVRNTGCYE
jgi:hypothetical protein